MPLANADESKTAVNECFEINNNYQIFDIVNLFFISEGYTDAYDVIEFREQVTAYASDDGFFSIPEINENKNFFNVYAIFLPFNDFDCVNSSTDNSCVRENMVPLIGNVCFRDSDLGILNNDKKTIIIALNKNFQGNSRVADEGIFTIPVPILSGECITPINGNPNDCGGTGTNKYIVPPIDNVISDYLKGALIYLKNSPKEEEIPDSIIEKSNQFIISKVGQEFFNNYMSINKELTRYIPANLHCIKNLSYCADYLLAPNYFMVYSLKIPNKPYANVSISFSVDKNGNIIAGSQQGLPDCVSKPSECEFLIDENDAIKIARNAGLEEGISDWKTSFHWAYGNPGSYVWTVQNYLSSNNGKIVMIDANSGDIIGGIGGWDVMYSTIGPQLTNITEPINYIFYIIIGIVIIIALILVKKFINK